MASASSSSSSATKEYDVFISFRGEDTRHSFTSHLYSALSRCSIKAYIDYELNKGDDISPALIQAIQDSHGSLIVFSENYASSKRCLNELLKILECRKEGRFVIPVFYKINPSHVRKQTASYAEAFAKHEQNSNSSKETLHKWKVALSEAANIPGWDSESGINRDEAELIQNILENVLDVLQKLDHIYQSSQLGLVGIEEHCGHIESLLQKFPLVGIWGLGGIGKTTIAKATFDKLSSQYDSCCFIENVREKSIRRGLYHLRDMLLSRLLKDYDFSIMRTLGFAMRRLRRMKVLIVLDDVNCSEQLKILLQFVDLEFHSRVILTGRDKHVFVYCRVNYEIYKVEGLNFEKSLQLFSLEAFNKSHLEMGFEKLSEEAVVYAQGIPLALIVLGTHLRLRPMEEWESALKKVKKNLNKMILNVLRLSYDGLNDEEKQIFLDIACFLNGEQKGHVIGLLNSFHFDANLGIRILEDKTFVSILDNNQVIMHDLMKETGWEIVRSECYKKPEKRSRLWDPEEVYDVLKNNKGTDAIEGIALDVSQIRDLELNADTFKKMTHLRFIKIYSSCLVESPNIYLCGDIESISDKLRYFYWNGYPSSSLPLTFCAVKLVQLRMPNSHIKELRDSVQDLANLKELDLHGCKQLMELSDFSMAPNLEVEDDGFLKDMGAVVSRSSSSAAPSAKKYDVFISFRGTDTRGGFTSHLRHHLHREQIEVFFDGRLEAGAEIGASVIQAIENSRISVVVFSKNYASSKWCLHELTKILECKNQDGQIVIPVFYEIDPSHVRKQTESYREAFIKHERDLKHNEAKLQTWKDALTEAANLSGWDSRNCRDESVLIEKIVVHILKKLDYKYANESKYTVGIEESCVKIESLLAKAPIVGIWGMGGIGKTTIAKVVFSRLFSQYERCCFLKNIRQQSCKHGLDYLGDKLLHELLAMEGITYKSKPKVIGSAFDMRRLSQKKILVVLDDVASSQELAYFARYYNCLRPDSRVIITSRDKHLLGTLRNVEIYKVKELKFSESLKLFSLNAFGKSYPEMGFEKLSERAVVYAQGIPLALIVLGAHLRLRPIEEWESALKKVKKNLNKMILEVLKLSYDDLDDEEKQIFLDIACFLNGEQKGHVIGLLNSFDFYANLGIRILEDKALVSISDNNQVIMHDLMKETGRQIVCREYITQPEKRSRLWDPKEVYDVLKNNKGTDAIEGIALDVSQIRDLELNADTFKKMTHLRFIKIFSSCLVESPNIYLRGDIESISDKLRYFYWNGFPSSSLPLTFCAEKLVQLHMPNSHIKKLWDSVQDLANLKELDLHGCKQLMELPDFSMAPNLEVVLLYHCSSLCHVHPSLLCLHSLVKLNLESCINIKSLHSEIHLRSLCYLNVEGCFSLKEFSLSSVEMRELDLSDTAMEVMMPSIGRFNKIRKLYIGYAMKKLPNELSLLKSLEVLSVSNAEELDTWNLDAIFDGLQSLKSLGMTNCIRLCQLPDNIGVLSSLTTLSLNGSNVESLPASIKHLSCLENLDISNCRMLRFLPELPRSIKLLEASNCTSMEKAITSRACWMKFTNCVRVDEDSLYAILDDFHFRVKQGLDINVCLPGYRVPMWFIYQQAHASITIELPPCSNLLGFAFCLIVPGEFIPSKESQISIIGFECCLEDCETVREASCWYADEFAEFADKGLVSSDDYMVNTKLITDHVYLWYQGRQSKAILKAAKNGRANKRHATSNLKLSFQFSVYDDQNRKLDNAMIKECGVLPIYASKYQSSASRMEVNLESGMDDHQQLQRRKFHWSQCWIL